MRDTWCRGPVPAVGLIALTTAACGIDFTAPAGNQPAQLSAELKLVAGDEGVFQITGTFAPGTDDRGRVRTIKDERLTILDRTFFPKQMSVQGRLAYEGEWVVPWDELPGSMELQGPSVEGVIDPAPRIGFRVCRGQALEAESLTPSDTLEFSISCVPQSGMFEAERLTWELKVTAPQRPSLTLVRLQGSVGPPRTITLPVDWIPMGVGPAILVEVEVRELLVREDPAMQYRVTIGVLSRMGWLLEWE